MSHVVSIKIQLKDLEALKLAAQRLGGKLHENRGDFKWYGQWVDDSPIPRHLFTDEEYEALMKLEGGYGGPRSTYMREFLNRCCQHKISLPGCEYEVGLMKKGEEFIAVWDWFSSDNLGRVLGADGGVLAQAYAVEKAKLEAKKKGLPCEEKTLEDGTVKLLILESY